MKIRGKPPRHAALRREKKFSVEANVERRVIERVGYGYTFVPDVVQRLRLHMPRLRTSPVRDALADANLGNLREPYLEFGVCVV